MSEKGVSHLYYVSFKNIRYLNPLSSQTCLRCQYTSHRYRLGLIRTATFIFCVRFDEEKKKLKLCIFASN